MAPNHKTEETPGVPARRAALRLLDAVLRRGDPLDQVAPPVLRAIERADDRALAMAIVQEALRWLPDLDALIDSATQTVLPDDAKARAVLQLMLAQALRLGLPPHAVIATGLPLLMGGPRRLAVGDIAVDPAARRVTLLGDEVKLSPKEYDLLRTLAEHAGQVVTHRRLLLAGWGDPNVDPQYLRSYIALLRQKLEEDPAEPRLLITEPGVGYRLRAGAGQA